jgi:hypothetical protein
MLTFRQNVQENGWQGLVLPPAGMRFAFGREQTVRPVLFLERIFLRRRRAGCGRAPIRRGRLQSPYIARCFKSEPDQKRFAARTEGQTIRHARFYADPARQAVEVHGSLDRQRTGKLYAAAERVHHNRARVLGKWRRGRQRGDAHGNLDAHARAPPFPLRLCGTGCHEC